MTHFKYEDEVFDLDDLADFLDEHVEDSDFDEHVNYESDLIDILGHDFEASEVLRQMDESEYYREKRRWLEKISDDNIHCIDSMSIGEEFTFDNVCIAITICDEDGNTEAKPVTNLTIPEALTVTPLEDKKYLVQGLTDEEGNKFTLTLSKEKLIVLNNEILNL